MNPSGGNDFHGKNSPPRPGCGGGGGGGGGGDNNIHLNLSAHHLHPQQQFLLPSSSSSQNNNYANLNAPPVSMLDESSSIMRLDHTRPEPAGAGLSSSIAQTTGSEKSGAGKKHTTTSSAADDDVKTMDPKRRKLDLKLLSKAHHQKKSVRFAARADQNSRNLKNSPPQPFLHPQEEESSSSNDSSELSRSKNETHVFRRKQETRKLCAELLKNSPQKIQDYQTLFRLCEERSALAGDTTSNSSSKSKSKPSSPSSLQRAKANASGSVLEILGRIQQADDEDGDDGDEHHCCCRGLERLLLPACQETRERHLRAVLELQAQTPPNVEPELKSRILRAASLKFSKSSRTFAKLLARSDHLLLAAPASATQVSKKT